MHKTLLFTIALLVAVLLPIQFAPADFLITNGSPTESAWFIYSTWRDADHFWPAGWRTRGWYEIEPGGFRNLEIPEDNEFVYIRVERPYQQEILPPDAATRDSYLFWHHPSLGFAAVQNNQGDILHSARNFDAQPPVLSGEDWALEQTELYEFENGGQYNITATACPVDLNLPVDELYAQAMPSVLWIENIDESAQGSGALIDVDRKLAVTNQHVVGDAEFVFVSFPVSDENGYLIGNRDYYEENYLKHALEGNGSWARVIAKNAVNDVAILQLDYVRPDAQAINHDFSRDISANMSRNEIVHILGNPGRLALWRWTLGLFQSDDGEWIETNADIYSGNSGGPVLNGRGELIGIITASDLTTGSWGAWATPARFIKSLLDTVQARHTIRIENLNNFAVSYEIKWNDSDTWQTSELGAYQTYRHWWSGGTIPAGYPKIRFNSDGVASWGADTTYNLDSFLRYFGENYGASIGPYDALSYSFSYDPITRTLDLYLDDNDGCVPLDVNGDNVTDLQDLAYISERIGNLSNQGNADVNNDGVVDSSDVIFAAGLTCTVSAAPALVDPKVTTPALTAENLQRWIDEGKALGNDNPTFQRGIAVLENLLAALSRVEEVPTETSLLVNYPNPFNPETWIPYNLSEPAAVTVTIYGADGRTVRTLALGHQPAGTYQNKARAAYWDGRNELGEPVASGVYFYTLEAGNFRATRKMVITK